MKFTNVDTELARHTTKTGELNSRPDHPLSSQNNAPSI
jgi:hypothetical protein